MGMIGPCERAPDGRCKLPTTTEVVPGFWRLIGRDTLSRPPRTEREHLYAGSALSPERLGHTSMQYTMRTEAALKHGSRPPEAS